MNRPNISALIVFLLMGCATATAEVRMPALFGDHMVLQQDAKLPVWGWAGPGEKVSVTLGDKSAGTAARADGTWRVDLPPFATGTTPLKLTVAGKNTLVFQDVLVGEVWLASGQSNMAFALNGAHNAATEIPQASDPELRFFVVAKNSAAQPLTEAAGRWEPCSPETAARFSAVAYFFAKDLRHTLKRPVGVIGTYWGGTPAQAWTSLASLQKGPPLTKYVAEFQQALEAHGAVLANPRLEADYEAQEKRWKAEVAPAFNAAMKEYNAANDAAKAAGKPSPPKPVPSRPEPVNPDPTGIPNSASRPNTPSVLFNAMIAPCVPYAIKGVIWYQGEANGSAGLEYRTLFPRMITGWREAWAEAGEGDFPFLFVQLPGWIGSSKTGDEWAHLREAQLMTLSLPRTGMAVTIDLGDPNNVHPKEKLDVGLRLALAARKTAYGQDIVYSGPIYDAMKVEGGAIRTQFTQTAGGLTIGSPPWVGPGIAAPPTDKLVGFTIAGDDRKFFPAEARIDGDSVLVSSREVPHPVAVRYGWLNSPECNLYNKEALPASPFRTDDWPAAGKR